MLEIGKLMFKHGAAYGWNLRKDFIENAPDEESEEYWAVSDNHEKFIKKSELRNIFEMYYGLVFGQLEIKKVNDEKLLEVGKLVKNEVLPNGGKMYEIMKCFESYVDHVHNLEGEEKLKKGLHTKLKNYFPKVMEATGEMLFMYGVNWGKKQLGFWFSQDDKIIDSIYSTEL